MKHVEHLKITKWIWTDAIYSYDFIKDVITDFHGDGEKFYPTFYKAVSEELLAFKNLSRRYSVLLGFEVANLVLALAQPLQKKMKLHFSLLNSL